MKLSDLPADKIQQGLRVWNAKKTQQGTVEKILPKDREDISILIKWDNGNESCPWHFWCDNIEIVIPPCCYVCYFEKPEFHCELLNKPLKEIHKGKCPPDECPLR